MIVLHQLPRAFGLPNMSPACMKLEAWLRMAKLPYTLVELDLARAPKGKVPFIEDEGRILGDSNLIVEDLVSRYGVDPDAHLTAAERAASLAFRRMLDENFYWALIDVRWRNEASWPRMRETMAAALFPALPPATRNDILDAEIKPMLLQQQHGQGMGRHAAEEIQRIGIADMKSVADWLGEKPYFMGDRISTADATVLAFVANVLLPPLDNPIKSFVASHGPLSAYCTRLLGELFPDLAAE
jgi:glutathione S-transferase